MHSLNFWQFVVSGRYQQASYTTTFGLLYFLQLATTLLVIFQLWRYDVYQSRGVIEASGISLDHGHDSANVLSQLFFLWTNPLLKKGAYDELNAPEDLFKLPATVSVQRVAVRIEEEARKRVGKSLARVLLTSFGTRYFLLGILKFVSDNLNFAGPLLLHALVEFMSDERAPISDGLTFSLHISLNKQIRTF